MAGVDTLFGKPIPFPKSDLYTALITVVAFLPALVIINFVVTKVVALFSRKPSTKAE